MSGCARGRFFRETGATGSIRHRVGRGRCARSVASPVAGRAGLSATHCRRLSGNCCPFRSNSRQARKRPMNHNDQMPGRPGWPRNRGHAIEFGALAEIAALFAVFRARCRFRAHTRWPTWSIPIQSVPPSFPSVHGLAGWIQGTGLLGVGVSERTRVDRGVRFRPVASLDRAGLPPVGSHSLPPSPIGGRFPPCPSLHMPSPLHQVSPGATGV